MLQSELKTQGGVNIDYRHLFHDLPEAYALLDAKAPFTVLDTNIAYEQLVGIKRRMAVGKPLFELFPEVGGGLSADELTKRLASVVRTGKPKLLESFRYDIKDADGVVQVRYWTVYYRPIMGPSGAVQCVLAAVRDVTTAVRAERRALSMEGRLQAALNIGKVGSWLLDVETGVVTADRSIGRLFNLTKQERSLGLSVDTYAQFIYPADRQRVLDALYQSIHDRTPFDEEFRIVTEDDEQRWVLVRGKVEEEDGKLMVPGVLVDVTERHDLQAQVELARRQDYLNRQAARMLQKRNEELEAISNTKDEFVALASHQLRTPATAVKQYLGMVLQGYAGPISEVQADMLAKAFEGNERQIQIINQILNAARADTGRLIVVPIPADMRALVRGVCNDIRALFEQRNQRFSLVLPRSPVMIMADQGYLRMAIENILNNACIYTPDGGTVKVKLERVGDMACLSVTDTGVGIKKADFGKLFAKFSRIHNPLSVQAGGSGIGLYLASEIVRLHGGAIDVKSRVHQGTTFAISIPLLHNKNPKEDGER